MPAPTYLIDEKLKEWATPTQAKYIDAVNAGKSMRAAARSMGVGYSAIQQSINSVRKKAAIFGWSPAHDLTRPVAPGQRLRGASSLYKRGEPEPVLQWVKSTEDQEQREELMRAYLETLSGEVKGRAPITKPPQHCAEDLLCVYPMGDPHFGMYAWWQECGDNFDLAIAERLTKGAVDRLVSTAPSAATAILLNLGDMYHADNQNNTSKSGHQLDVDGRWKKVQQVGLEAMLYSVQRLLEKHRRVIFRINGGNHDGHSSYGLAMMLKAYFRNESRVEIDTSASPFWYHQFGQVLIGSTHGDSVKGADLVSVMAADMAKEWGSTKFRHWYVGHVHHQDSKEYRGGTVEYFRTLAARDAWHNGEGYRAGRDMRLIVHHKDFGEIERHRCDVAMLEAASA